MYRKHVLALCGAILALAIVPTGVALAAGGTTVTVRIEGKTRTLLAPTSIHTHSGSITEGGAPKGACPATSAAGALDVAAHHRWYGRFEATQNDVFITRILGEHETGTKFFWDIFVNNVSSSSGACGVHLHRGDQLLFAVVSATSSRPTYPIALRGPRQIRGSFKVQVVWFNASGKAKPLAKARVSGAGVSALTDSRGFAVIHATHAGTLILSTAPAGYIRAVPLRVQELP